MFSSTINTDTALHIQSPQATLLNQTDKHRPVLVAYSEATILPLMSFDGRCQPLSMDPLKAMNTLPADTRLVMIAEEEKIDFPRYALYVVEEERDVAIITEIMELNAEAGSWCTVPTTTVQMLLDNYTLQARQGQCDRGTQVSYPAGFVMSAVTQLAIFKLVYDLTDNLGIAFAVTTVISLGAMFYMKAAYSNNLMNQQRVEFNPDTPEAQSLFVNRVALSDFRRKITPDALFAIGAPLTALSLSADAGLAFARMGNSLWLGVAAVVIKSIEDLLTSALRAVEQLRLLNPTMGHAHELPLLGFLYRSAPAHVMQKALVAGAPLLVSGVYTFAAFSLLNHLVEHPDFYLKAILGLTGLAASLGTVPVYSTFELGSAERNLARTGDPIPADSRLRFFQNIGKTLCQNASNSPAKKAGYTLFHTVAQGPTVGGAILELLTAFLPDLPLSSKISVMASGFLVSLLFSVSKNKRIFEPANDLSLDQIAVEPMHPSPRQS